MSKPHYYSGLDSDSKLTVELSMRELAEKIVDMNYGVHRLLSHLVDVRRDKIAQHADKYHRKGDYITSDYILREGDPLMEGVLKLLNEGHD